MRSLSRLSGLLAATAFILLLSGSLRAELPRNTRSGDTSPSSALVKRGPGDLQLTPSQAAFTENKGQVFDTDGKRRDDILFTTANGDVRMFFSASHISYVFTRLEEKPVPATREERAPNRVEFDAASYRVDMDLLGANPGMRIHGEEEAEGTVNYYIGDSRGLQGVRSFHRIVYENVYPNIDLVFRISDAGVKYEFVVRPGGRPADIKIKYNGAESVSLRDDGTVRVVSPLGDVREAAPVSFLSNGTGASNLTGSVPVSSSFRLTDGVLGFDLSAFDPMQTLVIDPTVQWSTYYGGANGERGQGIATDAVGNVVAVGFTFSSNFPVAPGIYQQIPGGSMDGYIVKFNSNGGRLWATYFGGLADDPAYAVGIDASGDIVIAGVSYSLNLPVTAGAFQTSNAGAADGYLAKFTSAGALVWSTYLGGLGEDYANGISVDPSGSVAVTGATTSVNFPVSPGAFQTTNAGVGDAFVAKFNGSGARLWSTYYGGSIGELASGIAFDKLGNVLFTGLTSSGNFPVTAGAFQSTNHGYGDAFLVKLDGSGNRVWATYFGGADYDLAFAIAVDDNNSAFFTGVTSSSDLPVSNGAFRSFRSGGDEAFLAKFTSAGAREWCTYYGGNLDDVANGVGVDKHGNSAIVGQTYSPNFPVSTGTIQPSKAGTADAFAVKFNPNGGRLWATYYGGNGDECANAVALQYSGNVLMTGWTTSTNFPYAGGAYQTFLAGSFDAFVTKICDVKPIISASGPTNLCPGASVVLDAGPGYSSYDWYPSHATTQTITVSAAGKYTVTVVDGIGCTGTADTVIVNVATPIVADAGDDEFICTASSVQIGDPATGGAAPLSYRWRPALGLSDTTIARPFASPSATTKYFVTVTDSYNCTNTDSVVVTIYPRPSVNAGKDTMICFGAGAVIGNVATGGTPSYNYVWSPASGLSNAGIAAPTASPLVTTTYVVTVTDANSCVGKDTIVVSVDHVLAHAGPDRSACLNDSVVIGRPATGGVGTYTYAWSPSTGLSATNVASPKASPPTTTMYFVTATDSRGCAGIDTVTVSVYATLTALAGEDKSICFGGTAILGDTAVCGTPGYSYRWSPVTGLNDSTSQHPIAAPASTTLYTLTVTDAASNTSTDQVLVTVNGNPIADAGIDSLICKGDNVQIGNIATGGSGPYTYVWTPSAFLSNPSIARPFANPPVSTTYYQIATDSKGCSSIDTVRVSVSDLALNAGADRTICYRDTIRIGNKATGGREPYAYFWFPSSGLDSANIAQPKASPSLSTTYIQVVLDAKGCIILDTMAVIVNPLPSVNAGPDQTVCRRETTQIGDTATGGRRPYTYAWTPTAGIVGPSNVARPLVRTDTTIRYVVTVTDANGCKARDTVRVVVRPFPTAHPGGPYTICRGDSVRLGTPATGGTPPYSYKWTPTGGLSDSLGAAPMARPFFPTNYAVVVTDANGCQDIQTVFVDVIGRPQPLIKHPGNTTICEGDTITLSVDSAGIYNGYQWYRDTVAVGTSRTIRAAETGMYTVRVNTLTGCSGAAPGVFVNVIPLPRPRVLNSGPLTFCEGERLILKSDSNFLWSFLWSTGSRADSIIITESGTYYVTVTGPNGCVNRSPDFIVTVLPKPTVRIKAAGSTSFCVGGSVELDAGAGFASYYWSSGERTRKIIVNKAGSYTVTVYDANGCTAISDPVTVTINPLPVPTITPDGPTSFCYGGKVILDAGPGFADYLWSNGFASRAIEVDKAGAYSVTVRTAAGCTGSSAPITVTVFPLPTPRITALGATTFCNGDSVLLDAGEGYRAYLWSDGKRTRIIAAKTNGTYVVTVTDSNGCASNSPAVAVTVHAKPQPVITASGPLSFCPGDSVTLDAGANYATYSWSNGESTRNIVVKTSGTFSVTVSNPNGCFGTSLPVTVTRSLTPVPVITANGPLTFCAGGSVELDAGSGWASYQWSTGARTRRITVTQSGLYNVRVSNPNGCNGESAVVDVKVKSNPPAPIISQNGNTLISTPATRYQWNYSGAPISGANGRTYGASKNGQYTVTIWSVDSCSSTSATYDFRFTGIEPMEIVSHFSVYPDPNNGMITVDLRLATPALVRISVSNVLGQQVLSLAEETAEKSLIKTVDLQNLPSGLYYLHVMAGEQSILKKIIKE